METSAAKGLTDLFCNPRYVERFEVTAPASNSVFDVAYAAIPQVRAVENSIFVVQAK